LLGPQELGGNLALARSGDREAREELIRVCQPFVLKITEKCCGRSLGWGRDDELSVSLMALNEAVDRFDLERSDSFLAFAGMVIKSRLKDYYRREKRQLTAELILQDDEDGMQSAELSRAWEIYRQERAARERGEEIAEYRKLLADFDVSFDELVKIAPKKSTNRRQLINAAHELIRYPGLVDYLIRNKRLPLKELSQTSGIGRKTLERGRKYIIAVALVLNNRDSFLYLSSYLKLDLAGVKGGNGGEGKKS
jgi:RNA polymerase sigma factor